MDSFTQQLFGEMDRLWLTRSAWKTVVLYKQHIHEQMGGQCTAENAWLGWSNSCDGAIVKMTMG